MLSRSRREAYHKASTACQGTRRRPALRADPRSETMRPAPEARAEPMKQKKSLLRTVSSISLATLVSRVLGLARDSVQSWYFGAGATTDAFVAAFRVPNLLRDLFAEGALSSAFVPTFTAEKERRGAEAAWALANRVISGLVLVVGGLTILIFVFAPGILGVYVWGFEAGKMGLAVTMTRILSPFLLFVAMAAVAMGVLNTCGRFFLPALAPASFNACAIAGVIVLYPLFRRIGIDPGLSLAVGALTGGAVQFLIQVPAMRREGFRFRLEWAPRDPALRRVVTLMVPATFGLAATQINILVDTVLASLQGDGPITWLALAFRLMQLPIGLFGVAIATANLARVSRDAAIGDLDGMRSNLAAALRMAALLTLPATAGLVVLREPIVRVLFQHGPFTPESTVKTAAAVLCYALGLYAYSLVKVQVPTFYALGDTRTPVIASAVSVTFKIAANFALLAALPRLGLDAFLGLALSTSLAAWINMALLTRGLRRHLGPLTGEGVVSQALRVAALAAAVGIVSGSAHLLLARTLGGGGLLGDIARLVAAIVVGILVTVAGAALLRLPEFAVLRERLVGWHRGRPRN
jgi:putative peptidoglycan lipid II flippase